jgi:hypothetical protein
MFLLLLATLTFAEEDVDPWAEVDPAVRAEYFRLHDEMLKLAKRQVWTGVARLYEKVEVLEVPLTYDDYVAGAMAARHEGEVLEAYERLTSAAKIDGTREVIDWLWSIDTAYGRVRLGTEPLGPATLTVEQMPMLPDQRAAVEAAQRRLEDGGSYDGMLPEGTYTFAGQTFSVTPGPKQVQITVTPLEESRKKKRDR